MPRMATHRDLDTIRMLKEVVLENTSGTTKLISYLAILNYLL